MDWDKDFRSGFASVSLSILLANFTSLAVREIGKVIGFNKELRKLERMLYKIQAMINVIELGYPTTFNKLWDIWLAEANRLTYDVEDLFEELIIDLGVGRGEKIVRQDLVTQFKLATPNVISTLVTELQELVTEMDKFFMVDSVKLQVPNLVVRKRCCHGYSSSVDEALVIGRVNQKRKVLKMLSLKGVSVICITGMAGSGKTAFTQLLVNTKEVVDTFKLRIWVSVSVEFDVVRVTRSVIESVSKKSCKLMELELLQSTLKELLEIKKHEKRKILVVLDDFWSEEYEDWEKFYAPFKGSENCKVIITTRSSKVSSVVGAEGFHLPTLSDEDCWEIMRQRPFLNHQLHNWEEVGFQIAKKCKGVALVAKVLGELIHCIPDEWDSILKSKLGDLPQYQKTVVPVFLRSYYSLPPHLKKCFAYCSLFPPGHEFEMNTLVLLWMAEGLIQPISERRQEDIGREYFNDLLCRSFFNIPNEDPHVEKKIYKMHDFTLHMAQLISSGICHRVEDPSSYSVLESVRHLSLCYGDAQSMELQSFPKCEKVRTLMWLCAGDIGNQVSSLLKMFTILRVLDLKSGGITELPDEVGFLRYLRYLNVSNNSICFLPPSITGLSRLQTLVLKNCPLLTSLPENFSNLTSLQHLEFDIKEQLERMPIRFGNLVNLQSLDAFIVECGDGYTIQELKDMTCLQGSVCITKLENVRDKEAADSACLNLKLWIHKLELEWTIPGDGNVHLEVLTGLRAHKNLKELTVTLYCGDSFPSWISESCMLRVIHLRRCQNCNTLPSLGKLGFLECLILERMASLKTVDHDFVGIDGSVGFQSLKSLSFVDMPRLTRWVCSGGLQMPKLCDLKLNKCPVLLSIPSLSQCSYLKNIEVSRCNILGILPGNLVSIKSLIISNSLDLARQYQVDGLGWSKVKIVPTVQIDGVKMPTVPQRDQSSRHTSRLQELGH